MTEGFTLWFTGLSGSGKTTIAELVRAELERRGRKVEWLDGAHVVYGLSKDGSEDSVLHVLSVADGRDLPERIAESAQPTATPKEIPTGLTMEELEKLAITKALDSCAGNRTHAANRLGISVRTLQRKLRQYELEKRVKPFPNDVLTEA